MMSSRNKGNQIQYVNVRKRRGKKSRGTGIMATVGVIAVAALLVILVKNLGNGESDGGIPDVTYETVGISYDGHTVESQPSEWGTWGESDTPGTEITSERPRPSDTSGTSGTSGTSASSSTQGTSRTPSTSSTVNSSYAYAYAGFDPVPANLDIPEWNLLLMNRDYILPEDYSPALSECVPGTGVKMDARVSPYYKQMYDAAKADGITLTPLSGHRRISTQKTNFENKIQQYQNQGYSKAEATQLAAKIILPPGSSEHNAGLAMDICSLETSFENTREFKWLTEHAADYGFILRYPKNKTDVTRITYEPWHWRYVGVSHAKNIKARGVCLEEYLGVS